MRRIFCILSVLFFAQLCVAQHYDSDGLVLPDTVKSVSVHDSLFNDLSSLNPKILTTLKEPEGYLIYSDKIGYAIALKKGEVYRVILTYADTLMLVDLTKKKGQVLAYIVSSQGHSSRDEGGWHEDMGYVRIYDLDNLKMWGDFNYYFGHEGWDSDSPVQSDKDSSDSVTTKKNESVSVNESCISYQPVVKQGVLDFINAKDCDLHFSKVISNSSGSDRVRYKLEKGLFIRLKN